MNITLQRAKDKNITETKTGIEQKDVSDKIKRMCDEIFVVSNRAFIVIEWEIEYKTSQGSRSEVIF